MKEVFNKGVEEVFAVRRKASQLTMQTSTEMGEASECEHCVLGTLPAGFPLVSGRISALATLVFLWPESTSGEGFCRSPVGTPVFQEELSLAKVRRFKDL